MAMISISSELAIPKNSFLYIFFIYLPTKQWDYMGTPPAFPHVYVAIIPPYEELVKPVTRKSLGKELGRLFTGRGGQKVNLLGDLPPTS